MIASFILLFATFLWILFSLDFRLFLGVKMLLFFFYFIWIAYSRVVIMDSKNFGLVPNIHSTRSNIRLFFHPLIAPNSPLSICLILLLNPHSHAYSWKCILFGRNILLFCAVFVAQSHQLLCCWKFWYKQFRIRAGSSSRLMVTSFMWVLRVSFHVHICVLLFRQQQTSLVYYPDTLMHVMNKQASLNKKKFISIWTKIELLKIETKTFLSVQFPLVYL